MVRGFFSPKLSFASPVREGRLRGIAGQTPVQCERLLWSLTLACGCLPGMTDCGRFSPIALQHSCTVEQVSRKGSERPDPTRCGHLVARATLVRLPSYCSQSERF
jgi:hypothetical protein